MLPSLVCKESDVTDRLNRTKLRNLPTHYSQLIELTDHIVFFVVSFLYLRNNKCFLIFLFLWFFLNCVFLL